MAAELRDKPVLTGEDARRFIERAQMVDSRRKAMIESGQFPQIKKVFNFCTLPHKN